MGGRDQHLMFTDRTTLKAHINATPITGRPANTRAAFDRLGGPTQPYEIRETNGVQRSVFGRGKPVVLPHGGSYVCWQQQSCQCGWLLALISEHQVIVRDDRCAPEHR